MLHIPGVLTVIDADDAALQKQAPVVIDSPHSGIEYPEEFDFKPPFAKMQWNVDMYVNELMENAPQAGAALLYAHFPRCFIDAHRNADDIDETMLASQWPHPVTASIKTQLGRGLLRKFADKDMPIYDRKLTVEEVQLRIQTYYQPYHDTLQQLIEKRYAKFGGVWHLNMHSMPPFGRVLHEDPGQERPDIAIANKHNGTSSKEFLEFAANTLSELGYNVWKNKPYTGQVLVTAYSDPETNKHSLQIELNRKHYMNWEDPFEKTAGFATFKKDLTIFTEKICKYACEKTDCC